MTASAARLSVFVAVLCCPVAAFVGTDQTMPWRVASRCLSRAPSLGARSPTARIAPGGASARSLWCRDGHSKTTRNQNKASVLRLRRAPTTAMFGSLSSTTSGTVDAIAVDADDVARAAQDAQREEEEPSLTPEKKIPVTLLSGFLGAGKTTLLQQLLETARDKNLRIGVVVNDVAAVNVDSKLVRSPFEDLAQGEEQATSASDALAAAKTTGAMAEFVELGDGCICCSISDELFTTLSQLVALSKYRDFRYDHIVIEATGVAEPKAIRDTFQDAALDEMPLMDEIALDTLVTVVDSAAFLDAYGETRAVLERPDLVSTSDDAQTFVMAQFDGSIQRAVVDLLVEQVECADVILLNKADLVSDAALDKLGSVVSALNGRADVLSCVRGDAPLVAVLGAAQADGAAALGPVDEHKNAVAAVVVEADDEHSHEDHHHHSHDSVGTTTGAKAEHSHSHAHAEDASDCSICAESAAAEAHDHSHESPSEHSAHSHSAHSHDHSAHSHDHSAHSHSAHSHSHSHDASASATTAKERFGIDSFVYTRRRPFSPTRLEAVLSHLPADGIRAALGEVSFPTSDATADDAVSAALRRLVRSKGFMWLASSHDAAYYWSHAGAHFQAPILGRWWATLSKDYWPPDQVDVIEADFEGKHGDRRQEIVFIGVDIVNHRDAIEQALDACLLTDDEIALYDECDEPGRADRFKSKFFTKEPDLFAAA